jgi:DNA helicase II / ATP-dependent DNA helicase PcrA
MDNQIVISSDDKIADIDSHFRVIAGPGAGKTFWLVEHIKNVLQNSTKLSYTSKISCITYTTVGAEEILNRLGDNLDKVDVSTIHSFLYTNIVKPYAYLLKDQSGNTMVNVEEMDGHSENIATQGKIYTWQKQVNNARFISDKKKIKKCLENLDWILKDDSFSLKPRKDYLRRIGKYSIRMEDLPVYKQLYWAEGIIHHEDVLYFSYKILKEYPLILEHISAKYPFMFLDEFQDTNPIQAEIVKWIGNAGTVIGVIGDPSQSIYGFQGASRTDFVNFFLPNQKDYKIENNRRCGNRIVNLLNHVRKGDGLVQRTVHNESDNYVYYIECSGDITQTLSNFHKLRNELGLKNDYCILTRNNESVKKLQNTELTNIWANLNEADQNRERFLKGLLTAYKFVIDGRNELAVKEIIRSLRTDKNNLIKPPFQDNQYIDVLSKRSLAVDLLEFLVSEIYQPLNFTLYVFYESLLNFLKSKGYRIKKVANGKFKITSERTTIQELLDNLILPEEKSTEIRTIHKAKGTEFESVLIYLNDVKEIENLLTPDIESEENDDTRIFYVALSRAEDLLCIACPPLEKSNKDKLTKLNIIERQLVNIPI